MHYARRCIRAAYSRVQIPREYVAGRARGGEFLVPSQEPSLVVPLSVRRYPLSLSLSLFLSLSLSVFHDTRLGLNTRQATEIKSGPRDSIAIPRYRPQPVYRSFTARPLPLSTRSFPSNLSFSPRKREREREKIYRYTDTDETNLSSNFHRQTDR